MVAAGQATDVFAHRFQNPVLLAAGTAGFGHELGGVMRLDRLGGLVTKSVSLEPRPGNPPPRVAEFHGGMLNSVGLANPGVARVREELAHTTAMAGPCAVLVSVVGFRIGEYAEVVRALEPVERITAYELNLSCPNTAAPGIEFGADPECVREIVSQVRGATTRPLLAKLSPVLPDIAGMAEIAHRAGADGITVVNTMPGALFGGNGRPRLGAGRGGVSGPVLLPVGVEAVRKVRSRLPDLPIVGVGGVRGPDDVRQYLRAGARLVAIGTAALADPRLPERIVRALEANGG